MEYHTLEPEMDHCSEERSVCAIVVLYNGAEYIARCIEALLSDPSVSEIMVLDNGSTDESPSICQGYPVFFVSLNENYGFGRANNIGMMMALERGHGYVFLVNQDVYIKPNTVNLLKRSHIDGGKKNWVLCSVQMNGDFSAIDHNFDRYMSAQLPHDIYSRLTNNLSVSGIYFGHFYNAAAWLVPAEVLKKIGLFDPLFPHYREDEDYASRCIYHGVNLVLNLESKVAHDRVQTGLIKLETRTLDDQINRVNVRQLQQLKNIGQSFAHGVYNTFRFIGSRLKYSMKNKDYQHIKCLCIGTVRTFAKVNVIIEHRRISRAGSAFFDETKKLIKSQRN